jgi:hypothetical protein
LDGCALGQVFRQMKGIFVLMMIVAQVWASVNTENTVLELRKRLDDSVARQMGKPSTRQLWVPPEETGIVLHSACQKHGNGCPVAYVKWLQDRVRGTVTNMGGADGSVNDGCEEAVRTQSVEVRHEELLRERLREKENEHQALIALLQHLEARADSACAASSMNEYARIGLITLQSILMFVGGCALPFLALHALPSVLLVSLLVWIFVGSSVDAAVVRYAEARSTPMQSQRVLVDVLLASRWLECLNRLRLVMTTVMLLLVVLSAWTLWSGFESSSMIWLVSYVFPKEHLQLAIFLCVVGYVSAAARVMFCHVRMSHSALLRVQHRIATVQDDALVDAAQLHQELMRDQQEGGLLNLQRWRSGGRFFSL